PVRSVVQRRSLRAPDPLRRFARAAGDRSGPRSGSCRMASRLTLAVVLCAAVSAVRCDAPWHHEMQHQASLASTQSPRAPAAGAMGGRHVHPPARKCRSMTAPDWVAVWRLGLANLLFWSGLAAGGATFAVLLDLTGGRWAGPLRGTAQRFGAFLPAASVLCLA